MPFIRLQDVYKVLGSGPEKKVCLLLLHCGIGDDLTALPVVWQMMQDGYEVSVYCDTFRAHLWEMLGADVHPIGQGLRCVRHGEVLALGFEEQAKKEYGVIYKLSEWSVWQENEQGFASTDREDILANLLGVKLPEKFSFVDALKPDRSAAFTVYASESNSPWRSVPREHARKLLGNLQQPIIWLDGHARFQTLSNLLSVVYSAHSVIAVESGVAHIAAAFGKPLTLICGPTEPTYIYESYKKYNPGWEYTTVQGTHNECHAPCYLVAKNGFTNEKCCGKYEEPQCLVNVDLNKVVLAKE